MGRKNVALKCLLSLIAFSAAEAKVEEITLERFRTSAPCGIVGHVIQVQELPVDSPLIAEEIGEGYEYYIFRVTIAVVDGLGPKSCSTPPPRITLFLSADTHSSRAEEGEHVVVFAKKARAAWLEAVFGSSYWVVDRSDPEQPMVEVNWRNAFLLGPLELRSGETAHVPLSAVCRLWRKD